MIVWSLCLFFFLSNSLLVFASPAKQLCRPDQKDALLEFKSEFQLNGNAANEKTLRWTNNTDCCSWDGITCDIKSGKVVELNLWGSSLNGPLRSNSSLFRLQHLQSLNLSSNNLAGILPDSIGNLKYLKVLKLYGCRIFGKLPYSLGNLSHLTHLDLDGNEFTGELPESLSNLNQLTKLLLASSKLSGNFPSALLNLSELTAIDFSSNQFEGMLPSNMSSFSKLEYFDMSVNSFSGPIPSSLFMIPRSISKLVGLSYLDLSFWNTERGIVDFSIFLHLKSLTLLDISHLNTRSILDLSLFSNFTSLTLLHLSGNNLHISSTLHLPSPIGSLALSSCNISEFPKFLQTQTGLFFLNISANQFQGQVPEWLWRLPGLDYLDLSQNSFTGFEGTSEAIQRSPIEMLDISSNSFRNPFPLLPNSTRQLLASDNQFSGNIPMKICELVALETLVLTNNNFNGSIPRCFEKFNTTLSVLHLRNNSLSGNIRKEFFSVGLISLDVGRNKLSGELPKSLVNCTKLEFLNVEDNEISDTFPFWLRMLPDLQILVLRSNRFHGPIFSPEEYSLSFPKLRIFDISENHFTGVLPLDYFAGWSTMSSVVYIAYDKLHRFIGFTFQNYHKSVVLANKGSKMELIGSSFRIYKTIDVSGNRLQGDIPQSIGLLKELIVLNMSNNAFTGSIPPSLSNLTNLQSLDLSQNRLSGTIPPELEKLTFLAWMNFSNNMLQGPIPQGTQIQSQNSSSFAHNPGLCGAPLNRSCGEGEGRKQEKEDEEKEEKDQEVLSWIAAAIAYAPGVFCGFVIGHILSSYRHDWFMRIFRSFA
ncbi:hypothetical protein N665_1102s0015 [Sinapis alba]|nr:hypothetical protein N665_1102s0015 [Sinapis alba]